MDQFDPSRTAIKSPRAAAESARPTPQAGAAAADTAPRPCEHFIPLRKADLVRLLAADAQFQGDERDQFLQLCALVAATFHHEFHQRLEDLKELYAPFDPDSVTKELRTYTDEQRAQLVPELFRQLVELLERANYRRLSRTEIEQAAGAASDWGVRLQVDFAVYEQLEVYVRGDVVTRRSRRHWRNCYRSEEVDVPLYERLAVMFRLRSGAEPDPSGGPPRIYLKLFKNIPKQDLDMLLPCTRFKMTLIDRGRIILPTLSGVTIAIYKIVKGALLLAFAGVYGVLALLCFIGATIGYGVKSFLGYLRTRDKYQLDLTRNLYYQNLDNNAGVLCRLLDDAEEQEFREAILAYALLRREARPAGSSPEQLDRQAESYLEGILGFRVDFEVGDALAKLARLGAGVQGADGRWRAVRLADVLVKLDQNWDRCFRHAELAARSEGTGE